MTLWYNRYNTKCLLEERAVRKSSVLVLIVALIISCLSFAACNKVCEEHSYELIESKNSTCIEKGYDLYRCTTCQVTKQEEKQLSAHTYDTNESCVARECVAPGCTHIEAATAEHDYAENYVCRVCGDKKDCSLSILGEDFEEALLAQAQLMAGGMTGNYDVVVLGKEETLANIENYTFGDGMDKTKIVAGLFVKFDVTFGGADVAFTIYYNFGLQFSEEMTEDISVTYDGTEIWYLEVVDADPTILFEYSIT